MSAAAHGLTDHSGPQVSEGQDLEKSPGKTRRKAGPAWPKPGLVTQSCNPATWVAETDSKFKGSLVDGEGLDCINWMVFCFVFLFVCLFF